MGNFIFAVPFMFQISASQFSVFHFGVFHFQVFQFLVFQFFNVLYVPITPLVSDFSDVSDFDVSLEYFPPKNF
mgnify:CR=1 FL=1